jgi:Polyketide cyclase / dehydrase and lipid transport
MLHLPARSLRAAAFALLGLTAVIVPLVPPDARAHGPSRQKVTQTIEINAPVDKVWAVMGNFQDMSWLPPIKKTEGTGGNDVGAKRTLTLGEGQTIAEQLNKYSAENHSYSYEISAVDTKVLPVTNYSSTISVSDAGGKSVVEWKGAFYRGYTLNDPPPEMNDEAAVKAVTGVYQAGLEALKKKVEAGG